MRWKIPHPIKAYEALGAVADSRLEMGADSQSAKVYSSTRSKFYDVRFDPARNQITANDNGSFWVGYLGYPGIAFLLKKGVIPYDNASAEALKGIAWKDVNQKFKNDFEKTQAYVLELLRERGADADAVKQEVDRIMEALPKLKLEKLGNTARPPEGY